LKTPIVFQGGVAKLKSMKKAFESLLGNKIIVEDDCQLKGALGVALLASKEQNIHQITMKIHL